MRINAKIYQKVISEPLDVQELNNDVTVEIHSLNQNMEIFTEYSRKGKFAIWCCQDGKHYRLLVEDGYYERMRELYGKRVNQCWIDFWDVVEKGRGKVMKCFFLPLTLVIIAAFVLLTFFGKQMGDTWQLVGMGATLILFIVGNVFINKKIDKIINTGNNEAVEKIKNIIGHKHFDELMEAQRTYYDEFFGIEEDKSQEKVEESSETTEPTEETATTEEVENVEKEEKED